MYGLSNDCFRHFHADLLRNKLYGTVCEKEKRSKWIVDQNNAKLRIHNTYALYMDRTVLLIELEFCILTSI